MIKPFKSIFFKANRRVLPITTLNKLFSDKKSKQSESARTEHLTVARITLTMYSNLR